MIVEAFIMQNICPKVIHARDKRSYCFLEGLCKRIRTKLVIEPELPSLDGAEEDMLEHIDDSEEESLQDIMKVFDELVKLSDDELLGLPDIVTNQFEILVKKNILPEQLSERLDDVFNFTGTKGETNKTESNVISIKPDMTPEPLD